MSSLDEADGTSRDLLWNPQLAGTFRPIHGLHVLNGLGVEAQEDGFHVFEDYSQLVN